jgi:hypothetical protein
LTDFSIPSDAMTPLAAAFCARAPRGRFTNLLNRR